MGPQPAPQLSRLVPGNQRSPASPYKLFGRHDLDHAVAQDWIECVGDRRERDQLSMLNRPGGDFDALPRVDGPAVRIAQSWTVGAMQATPCIGPKTNGSFANPTDVFVGHEPPRALRDRPQSPQRLCGLLPGEHVV